MRIYTYALPGNHVDLRYQMGKPETALNTILY